LKILQGLIKPTTKEKPSKEKVMLEQKSLPHQMIDVYKWLAGHADHSFASWEKHQHVTPLPSSIAQVNLSKASKEEVRAMFLKEKYFGKWRQNMKSNPTDTMAIAATLDSLSPTGSVGSIAFHTTATSSWLKNVLFNPSSRMARQVACNMVETFCAFNFERKKEVVDLLTTFLDELKR
jgi:E3 ubiquitin-protein ligase UBR4